MKFIDRFRQNSTIIEFAAYYIIRERYKTLKNTDEIAHIRTILRVVLRAYRVQRKLTRYF